MASHRLLFALLLVAAACSNKNKNPLESESTGIVDGAAEAAAAPTPTSAPTSVNVVDASPSREAGPPDNKKALPAAKDGGAGGGDGGGSASPTKPSSCQGHADGYVCNSQVPYSAMACKDGAFAHAIQCRNTAQRCKKASATDWTATVTSSKELVCE